MRTGFWFSTLFCLGVASACGASQDPIHIINASPLRFEPAPDGNSPGASQFIARGLRYRFAFTPAGAALYAGGKTIRLTFDGAAANASIEGIDKLRAQTNIIHGNDRAKWRLAIPNYARLGVHNLYPGIDAVYYGTNGELEYDLIARPGSDPRRIRLRFTGARARLDRDGNLVAGIVEKRPVAYQVGDNGAHIAVRSRYRKYRNGTYGFALGPYDRARDVIIDPQLILSTYIGGSQSDTGTAIGHDSFGYVYVSGTTQSNDLSSNGVPAIGGLTGTSDIFLARIDPHSTPDRQLVYLSYVGGSGDETLNGMVVTPHGDVYLTGRTSSSDFPAANAAQTTLSGASDAFVMWVNPSQDSPINYSTYIGGSGDDIGDGITVDSKGRIFVAGTTLSSDFPVINGFQTANGSNQTAFVAGFDPSQSGSASLIYSSYIGGAGSEAGRGIAAARDDTVWVVGGTFSPDFPVTGFSYQPAYQPGGDGFIAHIDPSQSGQASLQYATLLSGSHSDGPDDIRSVVVDPSGRIIVAGYTGSQDFPITGANILQSSYGGNFDAFISILDPRINSGERSAQLIYSTFYGGNQADIPFDLKLDPAGNLYLTGFTVSPNLPVTKNALQPTYSMVTLDGFALRFNPSKPASSATSLNYSSYIEGAGSQISYGIDYDASGNIFMTGYTTAPLFDALGGLPKTSPQGISNAFLMGVQP